MELRAYIIRIMGEYTTSVDVADVPHVTSTSARAGGAKLGERDDGGRVGCWDGPRA